jgi:predicted GNAT family N-acyltransferase
MSSRGCRIDIVLAVGQGPTGNVPIRDLEDVTSAVTHALIPEPMRCFARVVHQFKARDLEEFAHPGRGDGLVVVSDDLVTQEAEPRASPLTAELLTRSRQADIPIALVGVVHGKRGSAFMLPPTGLDYLISDQGDFAQQLVEAVRFVGARIWLTLPTPPDAPSANGDSRAVIDFPRSMETFRDLLRLRFEIYRVLGYLGPDLLKTTSQLELDAFDPNAIHLVVRDSLDDEVLGCARLIVPPSARDAEERMALNYDSENVGSWCSLLTLKESRRVYRDILKYGAGGNPLPAASMGAYAALREMLRQTHPDLRTEDCCELSRLIVAPKARGQHLARRLIEAAVQIATAWLPRRIMLVECREHHRRLYEGFGFKAMENSAAESAGLLHTTAIAMWRDLRTTTGPPVRLPNAQIVLSDVVQRPDHVAGQIRRAVPIEAWVWSCGAACADKAISAASGPFELSIYNQGLVFETVRGLGAMLRRLGSKHARIQNRAGHSVEIVPSSISPPPDSVVLEILNLLH